MSTMKLTCLGPSLLVLGLAACTQGAGKGTATGDAGADHGSLADTAPDGNADLALAAGPEAGPDSADLAPESADLAPEPARDAAPDHADVAAEPGRDVGAEAAVETGRDTAAANDGGDRYRGLPQPVCVWNEAYQENYAADTVAEILAGARGCYVLIDPFASSEARAAIAQMRQLGNVVGCYISVGTCEDWRDDFAAMKSYCVSKQWGEWPGEYFVDRTEPGLVSLMQARIDKMAAWGCDLVELDNMDWAFDAANRAQYAITATASQGAAYDQALCDYMHGKGMGCMAKSSTEGTTGFDGLTVESSRADMDWWTPTELSGMLGAGKIGIVVHYDETDCAGVLAQYQSKYGSKLSFVCEDRALGKYRHFP